MRSMNGNGFLVLSLDLELMWGNTEEWTPNGYGRTHVAHVREVVSRLLPLFDRYQVKATFATVGLVMEDYKADVGEVHISEKDAPLYFAPDVIRQLMDAPNVEIGCQSYSHYVCRGKDFSLERFKEEIRKSVEAAAHYGIQLKSVVFPRNAIQKECLAVCQKYGMTAYRGNARSLFPYRNLLEVYANRASRLIDTYLNISGNNSYALEKGNTPILNIPASRFLRPYSRLLFFLEGLRFRRIRKEMEYAAKHGEVYHLWWHPHNFGADIDKNIAFLEKILKTYQRLHEQYGMESVTMGELAHRSL